MNFVSEFSRAFVPAVGWTIIHSFWLGTICAAVAGIALLLLRGAPSRLRYAVACASLILLVGLLGLAFVMEWKIVPGKISLRDPSPIDLPFHALNSGGGRFENTNLSGSAGAIAAGASIQAQSRFRGNVLRNSGDVEGGKV